MGAAKPGTQERCHQKSVGEGPMGKPAPTIAPWHRKKSAASSSPSPPTHVMALRRLPISRTVGPSPRGGMRLKTEEAMANTANAGCTPWAKSGGPLPGAPEERDPAALAVGNEA